MNPSGGTSHEFGRDSLRRFGALILIPWLLFTGFALTLQVRNGAYRSGFGAHPDESSHFVTGMLIYKYVTTALGSSPMPFAERMYAHYPAIAFGHWPPMFHTLEAGWALLFGYTRTSELALILCLTGGVATMLYATLRNHVSQVCAWGLGFTFVALPIVQRHTASIMAEIPLTFFAFGALLAATRYTRNPSRVNAILLGLLLSAAILVKGNAWAMLSLLAVPVLCRQTTFLQSLRQLFPTLLGLLRSLWIPPVVIGLLCVPFTLFTMKMARDGWSQPLPGIQYLMHSIPTVSGFELFIVGAPILVLALAGIYLKVLAPPWATVSPFWAANLAVILATYVFHVLITAGLEARYLMQAVPSTLIFAAAALQGLGSWLAGRLPSLRLAGPAIPALAATALILSMTAQPIALRHANMGPAALQVHTRPDLNGKVILVASSNSDEREELCFIAELVALNQADLGRAVIRGGKFISDSSLLGTEYRLRFDDPTKLSQSLQDIPVATIVNFNGSNRQTPHSQLLKAALRLDDTWVLRDSGSAGIGTYEVFALKQPVERAVHLPSVDLSRKLGRNVETPF
jgi:hypothetical protein